MNAASCYRPVDLQLCQGDILERVPHLYLKDFPGPIRKTTGTGNRIVYELEELAPGAQATAPEEGILVPAHCQITRAMLLTYDCEIDKDRKHRMRVDSAHRVASLTTVARQAMLLQFFRFFARVELDPGIFETAE